MDLQDKVIVMTGAGSGIGRATALLAARQGARLAISDIDVAASEQTAEQIRSAGGTAFSMKVDVTRPDQISALIDATVVRWGRLDAAFNNAGVGGDLKPLEELDERLWDFTVNINLKAVWQCMKHEIPHMKDGGSIVNTASVAGLVGFRYNAVYAATKHGVIGLTKSAALELAPRNIRVNALCPGFTDTPMVANMDSVRPGMVNRLLKAVPLRRLGTVDEIAEAAVWLMSDKSSFMTGQSMVLDGGITLE